MPPAYDDDCEAEVALEITDSIDLHTFAPRDIPAVVVAYVEAAAECGIAEVRIIHGKGKGVQRDRVQRILREHPLVTSLADGPADRGAWGATIAHLRCPDPQPPH